MHAFSDSVIECFCAEASFPGSQRGIVGGDDGCAHAVIAAVNHQRDSVPYPLTGSNGAEVVQDEDLGVHNRVQYFEFGGCYLGIVRVLDMSQQFAIVAKQALGATFRYQ
jgi:hypothetical protein